MINGYQLKGLGRWDALLYRAVVLDISVRVARAHYSPSNGTKSLGWRSEVREASGRAGWEYIEKYYSYGAPEYLREHLYAALGGDGVTLMNLLRPLCSDYAPGRDDLSAK